MPDHACWTGGQISLRKLTGILGNYWFTNCNYCRVSLCIISVWTTRVSRCMIVFLLLPFLTLSYHLLASAPRRFYLPFFVWVWHIPNEIWRIICSCTTNVYTMKDCCFIYRELWLMIALLYLKAFTQSFLFDESLGILLNRVNLKKKWAFNTLLEFL